MNAVRVGDQWVGGGRINSDGFIKMSGKRTTSLEDGMRRKKASPLHPASGAALGVASHRRMYAVFSTTGAIIRLLEDGTVVLNTGAVDIGQGSDTVLAADLRGSAADPARTG